MRFESAPELFQISLAFEQQRVRISYRNFGKANSIARTQLRSDRKIDRDHVGDFWITANGLAIIEKQNRFTTRRDLDRARSDCLGEKIYLFPSLKTRTVQPNSHSIGIGRDEKTFVVKESECWFKEATGIRSANVTQRRCSPRRTRPIVRWFPARDFFSAQPIN